MLNLYFGIWEKVLLLLVGRKPPAFFGQKLLHLFLTQFPGIIFGTHAGTIYCVDVSTKKFLQKIHTNTHKLTHMINHLRLFIRLDEQKQEIRIKACDIITLIHEVIETLQISYPDREF